MLLQFLLFLKILEFIYINITYCHENFCFTNLEWIKFLYIITFDCIPIVLRIILI